MSYLKKYSSREKGFAPIILLVILAVVGATGVGTTVAANNSTPGDPLFGLDKTIEEVEVRLASNDQSKARVKLEIVKERLEELDKLATENKPVDPAVSEAQLAVNNATQTLSVVETKFKENKITLTSSDLQALLLELQNLLATHQGLIRKGEIKIKDGEVKAKIKLFEQEASESAELIDDDLEDLEDDDQLNASLVKTLKAELKGVLTKVGDGFQLTAGGTTYILNTSKALNLDNFVGKTVEIKGTALNTSPTQITILKIELEEDDGDDDETEVEAKGFVRNSGSGFVLTFNGGTTLYSLSSTTINLNAYANKFVKVEGILSGNVLNVREIKVKQTSAPALKAPSQSPKPTSSPELDDDEEEETPKPSSTSNSNSGSGSSGSNSDKNDSDDNDDD